MTAKIHAPSTEDLIATVSAAQQWGTRVSQVTPEDVYDLLSPTDHSMAVWYERFAEGTLHSSPTYGVKSWNGRIWDDDDDHGRHRDLAIDTVKVLMGAALTVAIPGDILQATMDGDDLSADEAEAKIRATMSAKLKGWLNGRSHHAMIEMATSRKPFLLGIEVFDADPWALPCANGLLNLRNGSLATSNPTQMFTRALAVPYAKDAVAPQWEQFLLEIYGLRPDANRARRAEARALADFLQRLVGLYLTGDVSEHILPIFWGDGGNGKTTLLNLILALIGRFGQVAPKTLLLDSKHAAERIPNDIARLKGARLAVVFETKAMSRLDVATAKQLTGGDRLTARYLRKEFFDFDPTHKVALVTNNQPRITEAKHAIWRRVFLIPHTETFVRPGEPLPPRASAATVRVANKDLPEVLRAELPGILAWAVRGCLAWQAEGLSIPASVRVATDTYRQEQDTLGPWLADRGDESDPTAVTEFNRLYADYGAWAERNRERAMTSTAFGTALTERGFLLAGTKPRTRRGLRLRPWFSIPPVGQADGGDKKGDR